MVFGGMLASWEEELILGWVAETGGVGQDIREPLFIEQPSPEFYEVENES